jgi:DNA invertase Pin-like site-specific DNA recombinase
VNHIDHCRQNNNVENLEWCSQKENLAHARRAGRMTNYWKGRRSPNAALLDEQVRQIRREYALGGVSWDKLARKHELSKRAIGRVLRRETYTDV